MTTFYLVRHAAHDLVDRVLAGRKIDVALNSEGRRQAYTLARQLASEPIGKVIASPRRRAKETAEPIAAAHGISITVAPEIDEHDAGEWAGRTFETLQHDPQWRLWNERRGEARPPSGESMRDVQIRMTRYLDRLARLHPEDSIVLVSHAEPIRCVLLHDRSIPLAEFMQVDVPLASISTVWRAAARRATAEPA